MTESVDFEQALNICLDHLRAGETPEDCLARYPAYAQELAPLLRVAVTLQSPDGPLMTPTGFSAARARLLAHAAQLRSRQSRRIIARQSAGFGFLADMRRLVVAGVAVALLLGIVLSAGTVSAASASLPGSPLYPLKRTTENLVSAVAFTPRLKAGVHLAWVDRRLQEIETLAVQNRPVDEALLAALSQEAEAALDAAEQAGLEPLTTAAAHTEHQQAVLLRVLEKAPPAAQPGLQRALEASAQRHTRAQSALERAAKHGPPATPPGQPDDAQQPATPPAVKPGAPAATPQVKDKPVPPGKATGQEQPPGQEQGAGQGHGRGQGQDKASDANQGQGDKPAQDEKHPADNNQGQGQPSGPGDGPGQGHGPDKPDKPDHPGRDKGGK